ncbi:MAG: TolC family protein [Bacteroidota bacterium]
MSFFFNLSRFSKQTILLFVFTQLLLQNPVNGQEKYFLTMEEALNRALLDNSVVKSSKYSLEKAGWDSKNAWAQFIPSVSFNSRYMWIDEQSYAERDFRRYLPPDLANQFPQTVFQNSYFTSFDVTATLFNASIVNGIFISRENETAAEYNNKSVRQKTILDVISAYLNLRKSLELSALEKQFLELSELNYQKAERLFEAERYSKNEVLRWKIEYQRKKSDVVNSESYSRTGKSALNKLINFDLFTDLELDTEIPPKLISESERITRLSDEEILNIITLNDKELISSNSALAASQSGKDISQMLYNDSYYRYLPNLSASYSYAWRENNTIALDDYSPQTLMLNLNIPIFTGFKNITNLQSNYFEYKKTEENFNEQLLGTRFLLSEAVNKILNYKTLIELSKTSEEFSESNYDVVSTRREKGLVSNIEFIDASLNLQSAKLNRVNLQYDFLTSIVELYYLLGKVEELVN